MHHLISVVCRISSLLRSTSLILFTLLLVLFVMHITSQFLCRLSPFITSSAFYSYHIVSYRMHERWKLSAFTEGVSIQAYLIHPDQDRSIGGQPALYESNTATNTVFVVGQTQCIHWCATQHREPCMGEELATYEKRDERIKPARRHRQRMLYPRPD